ncbi:MAG: prephenate dehydrogenase [Candidatus Parcubacteria bacterium]|jgi:prephenate dehydrogenase
MKTVGIIGYGQFGAFMTKHLARHCAVLVSSSKKIESLPHGAQQADLQRVCDADIVIFSIPMNAFESVCTVTQSLISEKSIIIDVTSVKMRPLALLEQYFPHHERLGTHPIFGPQSGKDGIEGLPLVLCNQTCSKESYQTIKSFCSDVLKLSITETTPEIHDREMAHVQGLTHFIGRALTDMGIAASPLATQSYKQLVELVRLVGTDSWDLFETIQNNNPHTQSVRNAFIDALSDIEKKLHS